MLGDLSVLHTPQIVIRSRFPSERALGYRKHHVALRKDHVRLVVYHGDARLAERFESRAESRQPVRYPGIMLDIFISVKVFGSLLRAFALHYVHEKICDEFAVYLGLVRVGRLDRAVGLRSSGRIGRRLVGKIVPMLGYQSVFETEYVESDLFASVEGAFDIIVCNPPYIKRVDLPGLQREIREYEPMSALDGGEDGLDFYRRLAKEVPAHLKEGGMLLAECGMGQARDVAQMMCAFARVSIIRDYAGIERFVRAVKKPAEGASEGEAKAPASGEGKPAGGAERA